MALTVPAAGAHGRAHGGRLGCSTTALGVDLVTQQATFQEYHCGICGFGSWNHDDITRCVHSHTKAELAEFYRTGRYVERKAS